MYKVVIGLEVHCQLKTNSKNFSSAPNEYNEAPNTMINQIDLAFPGTLPVVNKKACELALKVALALNCTPPDVVLFDRKNYFYADLPGGFQRTQAAKPFGINGHLNIFVDDELKRVDITQLHLEEDTASLDHFSDYSLIDYNRAGIPLIEIVSEPCLHSAAEAVKYLESLRNLILYCEASDARSDLGQLRCDVNISLMKETDLEFGTKVEIKNINSFRYVKEAIEYEIKRQSKLLDAGKEIVMETRRYDDHTGKTYSMREKVEAVDYKYFIEPNIPPIKLSQELIDDVKASIPALPYERICKYRDEFGLSLYDATILVKSKKIAEYFESILEFSIKPKSASNWMIVILGHLNKYEISIDDIFVRPNMLAELIKITESGKISNKQGKEILYQALNEQKEPALIIKESNVEQITDADALKPIILEVVEEHKHLIADYHKGKNVFDYFVGQVMKITRGKANPVLVRDILKAELDKYK